MKRLLLYSPDLIGHPRVYCRVIADALQGAPLEIVVAAGFTDAVGLAACPDLLPLASRPGVRILDNREFSNEGLPHLTAEELVDLQSREKASTTLFIEADKSNDEFIRIGEREAPRLRGRNLGIYANTAEWYPGEDSFSGERRTLIAPTVRTTLGNIKRAVFERRRHPRHFFEQVLIRGKILDEILVKDERLAAWRGYPVFWMPEISRPASVPETEEETTEFGRREAELKQFLARNPGREPVLYFGDAAQYKGYDLFLDFVAATPGSCAIHAGRLADERERARLRPGVDGQRERLLREGRLLETRSYVHSSRLKELYFGAVRLYVTTHRLALSSSTVIQALELGKPVLVPDRGLLGHRVRTNGIGGVYRYGDLDDLARVAEALWNSDLTRFVEPARKFWARFSDAAIREFFVQRLVNE